MVRHLVKVNNVAVETEFKQNGDGSFSCSVISAAILKNLDISRTPILFHLTENGQYIHLGMFDKLERIPDKLVAVFV